MNRAKVLLTEAQILDVVGAPHNARLVDVTVNRDPFRVGVIVEDSSFPDIPPDSESPIVSEVAVSADGRRYFDWPGQPRVSGEVP